MNDLEAKLVDALDRLGTVLGRLEATRPVRDPGAGIELDADKVAAKAGKVPETAPDGAWQRIGEIIGAANAKVLASALGRVQGAGKGLRGRVGRAAAWVGASRVGRAAKGLRERVGASRVGRAAGKAGGVAKKVGGAIAGSMAGRAVGAAIGSIVPGVGTAIGAVVGGALGGQVGGRLTGGKKAGGAAVAGGVGGALIGGAMGGPLGAAGGAFAGAAVGSAADGAVKGLIDFKKETEEASRQLMAVNRSLAQYSGLMAVVEMRERVREIAREREKGDQLAHSAQRLMESDQRRKDNTKELEVLGQRFENWMTSFKNDIVSAFMAPLNEIAGGINEMVGDEKAKTILGDAMIDLKGGAEAAQQEAQRRKDRRDAWDAAIPGRAALRRQLLGED